MFLFYLILSLFYHHTNRAVSRRETGCSNIVVSITVRTDCSAVTLATTKAYLEPPINYLLVPPTTLNQPTAPESLSSSCQAADQPPNQPLHQTQHQPPHQPMSQPNHPDNSDPSLSQQPSSSTAPSSSISPSSPSDTLTVPGQGTSTATSSAATSLATATANNRLQGSSDG